MAFGFPKSDQLGLATELILAHLSEGGRVDAPGECDRDDAS